VKELRITDPDGYVIFQQSLDVEGENFIYDFGHPSPNPIKTISLVEKEKEGDNE